MPAIKQLKMTSVSRVDTTAATAVEITPDKKEAFYSLVESFLLINPSPSDEHMHMLATAVGMDPETFEQLVYQMFGQLLDEEADEGSPLESPTVEANGEEMPNNDYSHGDGQNYSVMSAALAERVRSSGQLTPKQKVVFNTDDIDDDEDALDDEADSIVATTPAEMKILDRAWQNLKAEMRKFNEHYEGETLLDHFVTYAQGDPNYESVFGKGAAGATKCSQAADVYLQDQDITAADEVGDAAANDGIVDTEQFGTDDPMKEAGDFDGAVDDEVVHNTFDL